MLMVIGTGAILVLIDIVTSLSPLEVAIPLLAVVGLVFGIALTQQIWGAVAGLATGAIIAAFAESTTTIIATQAISGVEGFLLAHIFLWIGLLIFAAGFSSHAAA
jgi:hypothetical protein